jgi:ADP-heptose:LPS heptosyltransferase
LFFRFGCGIRDIIGLRPTGRYPVRNRQGVLVRIEPEHQRLFNWIAPALLPMTRPSGQTAIGAYERQYAETILHNAGFNSSTVIACGPGSKVQAARWPEDRFETMGRELLRRRPDVRLVVLGSTSEHPLGERLCSIWGDRAVNLAGALTIWQSGALLERCVLYVGNDTGTMHLAASVGTPCVAIFSARANPGQWEPEGNNHIVLRHEVPCAGCGLEACLEHDLACLKAIAIDDVLRAADALLETPRNRKPFARHQHA